MNALGGDMSPRPLSAWAGVALTEGLQGISIFRQSIKVIQSADSCVFG